jgi:hypothetical protein
MADQKAEVSHILLASAITLSRQSSETSDKRSDMHKVEKKLSS